MKVSIKQLKAIVSLLYIVSKCDGDEAGNKAPKLGEFLLKFKISKDKAMEIVGAALEMKRETVEEIIKELDQDTKQEVSNLIFDTMISDGSFSGEEVLIMHYVINNLNLPRPNSEAWEEWYSSKKDEVLSNEDDEVLSNEDNEVLSNEDDEMLSDEDENEEGIANKEKFCYYVIYPLTGDDNFEGNSKILVDENPANELQTEEEIATNILGCKKGVLLEYKNIVILDAIAKEMGYDDVGTFNVYLAKTPADWVENRAASILLGTKIYGPCMIRFKTKEGRYYDMSESLASQFHSALQKRLDSPLKYSVQSLFMGLSDEEKIEIWLEKNSVEDDGFEIDVSIDDIMEDVEEENKSDVPIIYKDVKFYTVKDILLYIIDNDDERPYNLLIQLSERCRTYGYCSLGFKFAAYWAHLAVVLYKKAMPSEYSEGWYEMMEMLSVSFKELGDCFFSVDCGSNPLRNFPDFNIAAKCYEAANETDPSKMDSSTTQLGRSYLGLGDFQKAWDTFRESHNYAWMGQLCFIKRMFSQAVIFWDQAIEEQRDGWGEYFKGRYLWSKQCFSDAISLWRQGEKKRNAACSGELFNWIVGHPKSSGKLIAEEVKKIIELQYENNCLSSYKYLYKYVKNGNIKFNKIDITIAGKVYEYHIENADFYLEMGTWHFCPYCLSEMKRVGYDVDEKCFENAMIGWGYDGLEL